MRRSAGLGGAALCAVLAIARGGFAQDAQPPPSPPAPDDESESAVGRPRPAAADQRTGHLLFTGKAGVVGPAGSFATNQPMGNVVATSLWFGGSLGYAVNRSAVLEAAGGYGRLAPASGCSDHCSGSIFDLGLDLVYHVAQGIALDPWVSYGLGFRSTSITIGQTLTSQGFLPQGETSITYRGVDFARVAMGGDFYPIPELGIGPYFEADFGTNISRPGPTPTTGATYAFFGVGVRLTFDPMRIWASEPKIKAARR